MSNANALPRVIWDKTFTRHNQAGTRAYTQNLYRALAATGCVELQQIHNARAPKPSSAASNLWWLARGLEQALNARAPALFHAAAYLGPRRAPCPMIVNVFDATTLTYPQYQDWKWRAYARFVIPHTVRHAAAVITLTEHARGEITRAYQVAPERVHIVAPGIGAEFQPPTDADALARLRAQYGLGENFLLHLGEANGRKNIPALIAAFAQLRADFPQLTLVLAGPHIPTADAVTQAIRAHGIANAVTRLGYVPQADVPLLYGGARAFVYASKLEGFGMPPLEALACGTPVVAAPNPPMPEVLGDAVCWAENDSPAALASAMRRVLTNQALVEQLRVQGIARARAFTWERAARQVTEIYADILQAQQAKARV
ncbi:glycosyltransferase family 4 protein [Anaerolineae bacterium CFX7]|nr:glycosyltransferase family 4 protein [Anaerolineae bacterium CFX7]